MKHSFTSYTKKVHGTMKKKNPFVELRKKTPICSCFDVILVVAVAVAMVKFN